jgi:antitoxin CptB
LSAGGQLLWRCRRGTKELDFLLERYVRHQYPSASPAEQGAFAQILDLPDPDLSDYLLGHATPAQPELADLVRRITAHRD